MHSDSDSKYYLNSTHAMIPSTYEKLIPYKRIPYWAFWPVVGSLCFVLGERLRNYFGATRYLLIQFLFSMGIVVLPIVYIQFSHYFQRMMSDIYKLFWSNEAEFHIWLESRTKRIFTFNSWRSIVITGLITVPGILTIFEIGLPSQFRDLNIFAIVFFTIILILCGHGLYMCLDLLATLRELVLRHIQVSFFMMEHRTISKIQSYHAFVAATVTFAYIWLVIATWQSPYSLSKGILQVWLTILSFYPLTLFVGSFLLIHIFMRNIKLSHLSVINKEVQEALKHVQNNSIIISTQMSFRANLSNTPTFDEGSYEIRSNKGLEDVQRLEKLMDIQTKIENMREWPIGSQTTIAFIITLLTALTQVAIAYMRVQRP